MPVRPERAKTSTGWGAKASAIADATAARPLAALFGDLVNPADEGASLPWRGTVTGDRRGVRPALAWRMGQSKRVLAVLPDARVFRKTMESRSLPERSK
jgi:hypothetical protein